MVNNKIDYKLSDDIAASVLLSRTLLYFLNCEMLISNLLVLTFIVFSTQNCVAKFIIALHENVSGANKPSNTSCSHHKPS